MKTKKKTNTNTNTDTKNTKKQGKFSNGNFGFQRSQRWIYSMEIVNQDGRSQGDLSFKFIVSGVITIYTEIG